MGDEKLMVTFHTFDYHMTVEKQDVLFNQILFIIVIKKYFVNTFPLHMLECKLSHCILNLILSQS